MLRNHIIENKKEVCKKKGYPPKTKTKEEDNAKAHNVKEEKISLPMIEEKNNKVQVQVGSNRKRPAENDSFYHRPRTRKKERRTKRRNEYATFFPYVHE